MNEWKETAYELRSARHEIRATIGTDDVHDVNAPWEWNIQKHVGGAIGWMVPYPDELDGPPYGSETTIEKAKARAIHALHAYEELLDKKQHEETEYAKKRFAEACEIAQAQVDSDDIMRKLW